MAGPRVALIHALADSIAPAIEAFAESWPEADIFNLFDDSLPRDLVAEGGKITMPINSRIIDLSRYAIASGAKGILYTCSAFAQSIKAAGLLSPVPILKPTEAAVEAALDAASGSGEGRIAVLATFEATAQQMKVEIEAAAKARSLTPTIEVRHVPGALAALQTGRPDEHDRLIAAAAAALPPVDALLLAQFSMARAARSIAGHNVLTTPGAAVKKLKERLGG